MRALKLFIVLAILLSAVPSHAGLSDPNEIIENSHVATEVSSAPRPTTVTEKVTETVGTSVRTVKGWLNKGIQTLTGQKTKPAIEKTAQSQSNLQPQAPKPQVAATAPVVPAASAPMAESREISEKAEQQKQVQALTETFSTPDFQREVHAEDLQEARRRLKTEGAARVSKPGRRAQGNLKLSKFGVPLFPMEVKQTVKLANGKNKVVLSPLKSIPRLDIGEEPTLSKSDYLGKSFEPKLIQTQEFKSLPSPELINAALVKAVTNRQVAAVPPAQDLEKGRFGIDQIITKEAIHRALPKISALAVVTEKPVKELSETQLSMLAALMMYQKAENCQLLIGLFDRLSQQPQLTNEANFHIGQCAHRLKMTSLGFERLSSLVASEDRDYASDAIHLLSQDLPLEFEITFSKLIRSLKNQKLIKKEDVDEVNYLTAKGSFKEGDYQATRAFAEKVASTSPRYGNSQYLIGVSWFSLGNAVKGAGKLESLRQWMAEHKVADNNLNSLTAINLARIKFTQGRYKEALPLYMAIDKDHPLWVQGLIEQGWTQLAQDDFSGAIGNMYSLHSPYFKAVYKPESFVVRTIGYLNICQYGDAYRTLSWLEKEYRPWSEHVNQYISTKKLASDHYETAIRYLKGKSSDDVDGLPAQVIREMARQKEFLNAQTSLNSKAEETSRYEGMDQAIQKERSELRSREKKATLRFRDLKNRIAKNENEKSNLGQLEDWKRQMKLERELVLALRFQSDVLETSRQAYQKLHPLVMSRIGKETYTLREKAGRNLAETLARIKGDMTTVLENNEFLRYEVYAGSGENIRYQVAGGKVAESNRIPASVKPEKMQNWSFDGEYWEDEIGSYRSSLKNNCPQTGKMEEFFKAKNQDSGSPSAKGQAAIEKESK